METQNQLNYNRIAEAIDCIIKNFKSQPNLDEVAEKVRMKRKNRVSLMQKEKPNKTDFALADMV